MAWSSRWPSARRPGTRPLQHGDPARPQLGRERPVDRGGEVRQHGHRLVGVVEQGGQGLGEGLVPVVLRDEVDGERHDVDRGLVGERGQAVGQQPLGVVAGAPHVERVGRFEPGVEERGESLGGGRRQGCEGDAEPLGHVGGQHALGPGVVHRGDASVPAANPASDREALEAVGELAEVLDPVHAVRREQRLPPGVRAGHGARVRVDERPPPGRRTHRERDHGKVAVRGIGEHGAHAVRVPQCLEHQADDAGLRQRERVGEVVRGGGDQLLAGGDDEGVLQATVGAQHRREHRAGVGDQRDRTGRQRVPLEVADRAHAPHRVDEAHAATAADLEPVRCGDQLVAEAVRGAVHHGAAVAPSGREPHLLDEGVVGDAEQHQVDRLRYVGQGRQAGLPQHLGTGRVDQPGALDTGAAQHLGRHPPAEGVGSLAGADDRHRAALEHAAQPRTDGGSGHRPTAPGSRIAPCPRARWVIAITPPWWSGGPD